jgi:hypothetical protein
MPSPSDDTQFSTPTDVAVDVNVEVIEVVTVEVFVVGMVVADVVNDVVAVVVWVVVMVEYSIVKLMAEINSDPLRKILNLWLETFLARNTAEGIKSCVKFPVKGSIYTVT